MVPTFLSASGIPHQLTVERSPTRAVQSRPAKLVYCFPLSPENGDFVLQPLLGIGLQATPGECLGQRWADLRAGWGLRERDRVGGTASGQEKLLLSLRVILLPKILGPQAPQDSESHERLGPQRPGGRISGHRKPRGEPENSLLSGPRMYSHVVV